MPLPSYLEWPQSQTPTTLKRGKDVEHRNSHTVLMEMQMAWLLWKIDWWFYTKLYIPLLYDPAIASLDSYSQFSSVLHSVMSDSLWPQGLQHARPPCPWPTPGVYSNSCPLSQWCHPTISSSVIPFSSCPQSFPASGSFQMSQLFASGGQIIGASALSSVLLNEYSGLISFRMDWLDLHAVQVNPKSLLQHHSSKESILQWSAFLTVQLSHPYMITGKPQLWLVGPLVAK